MSLLNHLVPAREWDEGSGVLVQAYPVPRVLTEEERARLYAQSQDLTYPFGVTDKIVSQDSEYIESPDNPNLSVEDGDNIGFEMSRWC